MTRYRSGKIVATIGPATNNLDKLESLFLGGVDVFRLNFSHGSHESHTKVYDAIRSIGKKHNRHPTILADMQGPKLRIGTFENDRITLRSGDFFRLDLDPTPGNSRRVNLPHPEILEALREGTSLLLDDGKLRFEVMACGQDFAEVKVLVGGPLSNKKGVNVPNARLKIPVLTEKDLKDLEFSLNLGVDWIALSFVQTVEDVENARNIIGDRAGIISKLEKPLAIQALEPIVEASDAVMVARGDLGVEMNPEEVPAIQRRIIDVCHRMGRPVIVATQMLESMITSPSPTRAEVSDIATAVYCGADATMLSAESASGQYPMEAVSTMANVIEHVEKDLGQVACSDVNSQLPRQTTVDALSAATKNAAEYSNSSAIVLFSDSFEFALRLSRLRPRAPIIFATNSEKLANKVGLCHGVYSTVVEKLDGSAMVKAAQSMSIDRALAKTGDNIVVVNGISGNSLELCKV